MKASKYKILMMMVVKPLKIDTKIGLFINN
jgi:hypothetical protein